MSKTYRDRQTEKITRTYERKGKTDGEDNAYVQTYTRAQAEVAYIEGSVPISVFRFRVCFRFRFRRTRYCPVHMTSHTKVVPLQIIYRLCHVRMNVRDRQTEKIMRTYERIRVLRTKSRILKVPFPLSVSVSVSGSVCGSVYVVRGIAPYI